ncbi:uncharacterized protein J3D65DRAFT_620741 [Phyllosticta citribraziliensis]|uniref:Chromo domain-containing protein n=1 Tax=Phyllosticta citribraziliensis TaxID=989973 RepID=A0ABR1M214_9PEZI
MARLNTTPSAKRKPKRKRETSHELSDTSREWPVVRILDEHDDEYLLQWEGDWLPSWEPMDSVTSDKLVSDWRRHKAGSERVYHHVPYYWPANRIIRETAHHFLVEWSSEQATGATYEPSWVPKKDATASLLDEWRSTTRPQEKRSRVQRRAVRFPVCDADDKSSRVKEGVEEHGHDRSPSSSNSDQETAEEEGGDGENTAGQGTSPSSSMDQGTVEERDNTDQENVEDPKGTNALVNSGRARDADQQYGSDMTTVHPVPATSFQPNSPLFQAGSEAGALKKLRRMRQNKAQSVAAADVVTDRHHRRVTPGSPIQWRLGRLPRAE